jgi:hypothetical protein
MAFFGSQIREKSSGFRLTDGDDTSYMLLNEAAGIPMEGNAGVLTWIKALRFYEWLTNCPPVIHP